MSVVNGSGITRRTAIKSTAGAGAALLAGCMGIGSNDDDGTASGTADTIKYWNIHNSSDRQAAIKKTIQNFQNKENIQVDAQFIDNDEISKQISSAVASSTLPDIALLAVQNVQRLGNDDTLSSKSATEVIKDLGEDDFRQATLDFMAASDGGYYSVPSTSWVQGVWYRKSAFDEAGLEPPLTWNAILNAAKTFHDPSNNTYGIGFGNKKTAYTRQCFTQFARANGGLVFNENQEIVFDQPKMVEALAFVKKLGQYTPGAVSFDDTRQLYENEQIHMTMWSTNILRHILDNVGEKMAEDTAFAPHETIAEDSIWSGTRSLDHRP